MQRIKLIAAQCIQNWNDLKIYYKFTICILVFVATPLLLILNYNFMSLSRRNAQDSVENGRYLLESVLSGVEGRMNMIETNVHTVATNGNLVSFLTAPFRGVRSFQEYERTVVPLLRAPTSTAFPSIESLRIITFNTSLPDGYGLIYSKENFPSAATDDVSMIEQGEKSWIFPQRVPAADSLKDYEAQLLTYIEHIYSPYGRHIGYIIAEVRADMLFGDVIHYSENDIAFLLLDQSDRPLMSNVALGGSFLFPSRETLIQDGLLYLNSPVGGLSVRIGIILPARWQDMLTQNSFFTVLIFTCISIIASILFVIFFRGIFRRIRSYGWQMENIIANSFSSELEIESRDEIGDMGRQFNAILHTIRYLIQENIKKETARKDAQLHALLLQINPHFIYNTLDMFSSKLMLKKDYETAEYLCDFAQMIRYNTSVSSAFITLREEIDHADNYISLQRCRYGESLIFTYRLGHGCENLRVLRFLLQPVVENSFEHGFAGRNREREKRVSIRARLMGSMLYIRVKDNGAGIGRDTLAELNRRFSDSAPGDTLTHENRKRGIGLNNINERLKLFYKENGRLILRSKQGSQTSVFIVINENHVSEQMEEAGHGAEIYGSPGR